ncbi:hypothetical protein EXIGLDRAFT_736917 [Exidia glandulosa HHB12029]|uniref:Uncharacterized protein n=1 Tax=Exidia glandulosa HHB12029 TaxID=1314781 RepID=A0A165Z263_EXIGL|nr:hypothetical protein EXIGLDRAFT_736917 [Exidia glandulosa HHB12029]
MHTTTHPSDLDDFYARACDGDDAEEDLVEDQDVNAPMPQGQIQPEDDIPSSSQASQDFPSSDDFLLGMTFSQSSDADYEVASSIYDMYRVNPVPEEEEVDDSGTDSDWSMTPSPNVGVIQLHPPAYYYGDAVHASNAAVADEDIRSPTPSSAATPSPRSSPVVSDVRTDGHDIMRPDDEVYSYHYSPQAAVESGMDDDNVHADGESSDNASPPVSAMSAPHSPSNPFLATPSRSRSRSISPSPSAPTTHFASPTPRPIFDSPITPPHLCPYYHHLDKRAPGVDGSPASSSGHDSAIFATPSRKVDAERVFEYAQTPFLSMPSSPSHWQVAAPAVVQPTPERAQDPRFVHPDGTVFTPGSYCPDCGDRF